MSDERPPSDIAPVPPVPPAPIPLDATAAEPTQPPRRSRRPVLVAAIAIVVVLALVGIGIAVTSGGGDDVPAALKPAPSPTVPPPAGVRATYKDLDVTLHWTQPTGGIPVIGYRIYRGKNQVATVPVPETEWTDNDGSPGKHTYSIVSRTAGVQQSDPVKVSIKVPPPPLTTARLDGVFNVKATVTSSSGYTKIPGSGTLGWRFDAKCSTGPCDVILVDLEFADIHGTLKRSGQSYHGTISGKYNTKCGSTITISTLTIDLKITAGKAISGQWRASKVSGTLNTSEAPQLGCVGSHATSALNGTLLD